MIGILLIVWLWPSGEEGPAVTYTDLGAVRTSGDIPSPTVIKAEFDNFLLFSAQEEVFVKPAADGTEVFVDEFTNAVGAEVNTEIRALLDQTELELYRCQADRTGRSPIALILELRLLPEYSGNLFTDQLRYMNGWEATMAADLQPIIFPEQYGYSPVSQSALFTDNTTYTYTTLRQSRISFTNGQLADFYYMLIGDEVLFSSNLDCLIDVQEQVFDLSG